MATASTIVGRSRRLLKVVEAPLPRERAGLMAGGRIVITDDGRGVARCLENQLAGSGVPVERIGGPDSTIDWTSPAAIDAMLEQLRSHGPLAGNCSCTAHEERERRVIGSKAIGQPASASK